MQLFNYKDRICRGHFIAPKCNYLLKPMQELLIHFSGMECSVVCFVVGTAENVVS